LKFQGFFQTKVLLTVKVGIIQYIENLCYDSRLSCQENFECCHTLARW